MGLYNKSFFAKRSNWAHRSATVALPWIVQVFEPTSMLDVGCGDGGWAKAALDIGVVDVCAVDGEWARSNLVIPLANFRAFDVGQPFDLGRRFDLIISLEVGEHLEREAATTFVKNLTRHSDVIVFSAAAPFQGGVGHVNEQWPHYWIKKFEAEGYECFDVLRRPLWDLKEVAPWYRQNMLLFAKSRGSDLIQRISASPELANDLTGISIIHPDIWLWKAESSPTRRARRMLSVAFSRMRQLALSVW